MSNPFYDLDLKDKIDNICLSPYECCRNLICVAFKNKIVLGVLKFQDEFDDVEQEVEFEAIEEFYHGQRADAICWSPTSSLNKLPKTLEICVGGSDFSLRIFSSNLSSKQHSRQEKEGHEDYINDCSYDPEGEYLASVSDDCTCKLWSASTHFNLLNTFHLTSPGMSVSWNHLQVGKLMVAEKKGLVRIYNTLSLQPVSCVLLGAVPLSSAAWIPSPASQVAVLAAGQLMLTSVHISTHSADSKVLHPSGGYKLAVCRVNDNYVATVGRPGNSLRITHAKNKHAVVSATLEMFGGLSWHQRLPYLCVGNNTRLSIFKISPK